MNIYYINIVFILGYIFYNIIFYIKYY